MLNYTFWGYGENIFKLLIEFSIVISINLYKNINKTKKNDFIFTINYYSI